MMTRRLSLLLLLSLITAPATAAPPWLESNLAAVDEHMVPRYRQLAAATAKLEGRVSALCEAPGEPALKRARDGFHHAMNAWQGIQHIRFGPVERYLRHHRFQLWPDKHNTGAKQLAKLLAEEDTEVLEAERFRSLSVAVQGFGALEGLLFDPKVDGAGYAGYRCRLAGAMAANLAAMAEEIVAEWPAWRGMIESAAGGNDEFDSDREVAARLLNNLHTQLQAVADLKLDRPLGNPGAKAKPRRAESWRSRRSLRNIARNLEAAEALYRTAFAPRLTTEDEANRLISAAFAEAHSVLAAIDRPLYETARDPDYRAALERLRGAAATLRRTVAERLPPAIDIPLGFNSLDGD